jgi:hypothetical protein
MRLALQRSLLLVAAVFGAAAMASAPSTIPAGRAERLSLAPPLAVLRAAALGREAAAADLAWLRTIQFIGSPLSAAVSYEGLEGWIHLVTDLDRRFETPYFHGSILLATSPGREAVAAEILEKAERNLVPAACREPRCPITPLTVQAAIADGCEPCSELLDEGCDAFLSLSRGFAAYFGAFDAGAASEHFCEARRRGGPPYLTSFSARLITQATSCQQLRQDLLGIAGRQELGTGTDMLRRGDQQALIAVSCEERELKRAAAVFRLRRGTDAANVDELLEEGALLQPPWRPSPTLCWLPRAGNFQLLPCAEAP